MNFCGSFCRASLPVFAAWCMTTAGVSTCCAFNIVNRWNATQINGGGLQRGDPVDLRWSVVPDGKSYDRSSNSQLIQFLDDGWNVPADQRGAVFTNRPWWTVINNAYAQYARVSGISLQYVAEQNSRGASTGMFGDIRIGGENIDGTPGGALADNVFPDGGDMRIDTTRESNGSVGSYFRTEPGLRNLVIHETGHGVGLGHVEFVNNSAKAIMEGGLRTEIWGLQFDDVYGLNRQYGDPLEQGGGNDLPANATPLGAFTNSGFASIGRDAVDSVVAQFDDDWTGIDGRNDTDWFRFSVTDQSFAQISLTPVGPTYTTVQNGVFNASIQSDLIMQVYSENPSLALIGSVDLTGNGGAEFIGAQLLSTPGDYLVRVRGKQDVNQFYQLDVSVSPLPAPGMSTDLNLDGITDTLDWGLFVANAGVPLSGLTQRDAFMRGDLDLDGDNDFDDFRLFRSGYELSNGAAALANLSMSVPEPGAGFLLAVSIGAATLRSRRRLAAWRVETLEPSNE